jgi:hypothetical protein
MGASRSKIRITGSQVIPIPLFNVLDGKRSEDYIARVEPSAVGGRKIAEFLLDVIEAPSDALPSENQVIAPMTGLIAERR